jgi:hypothetical protein
MLFTIRYEEQEKEFWKQVRERVDAFLLELLGDKGITRP